MWSGDSKQLLIGVTGSDGLGVTLTGASAVWVLEQKPTSGSLVRITTDDFASISGSTITVTLSPSHTNTLNGLFYHETEVTDTSGNVSTVTVGTVLINKSGADL